MSNSEDVAAQLTAFGQAQLASLRTRDITDTTVHLILTVAFFTGATIQFASRHKLPKSRYLPALQDFLASTFGLDGKHAAGLVESNTRLYKNYTLIEQVYNSGWRSAQDWTQDKQQATDALQALLKKYRNLSMADLGIEGVKEKAPAPITVEISTKPEPVATTASVTKPPRRLLPWLIVLTLLGVAVYFSLFPEQLPPALQQLLPKAG
jgi:hypothetical protein